MKRIDFKFTRSGTFKMTGVCSVDINEKANIDVALKKATQQDFSEFLPLEMNYDEEDWQFELDEFDNDD